MHERSPTASQPWPWGRDLLGDAFSLLAEHRLELVDMYWWDGDCAAHRAVNQVAVGLLARAAVRLASDLDLAEDDTLCMMDEEAADDLTECSDRKVTHRPTRLLPFAPMEAVPEGTGSQELTPTGSSSVGRSVGL